MSMSDTAPDTTPNKGTNPSTGKRSEGGGAEAQRRQVEHDESPEAQGQGEGWAGTNPDEGEVEEIVPTEPVESAGTRESPP